LRNWVKLLQRHGAKLRCTASRPEWRNLTTPTQRLAEIVADLSVLRSAYSKAGLLDDRGRPAHADQLLGGGEGARFRREFLFVDAVVRHRVAWLALDCGALRHVVVF